MEEIQRKVKYESELDPSFTQWVATVPGGERIRECIQCGTCSSICPVSIYMDITPRRVIAMADAGFRQEVLSSFTIWLCASCYSCSVICPKDIKITDVMYAFKRKAIEDGIYPSRKFAIPILARSFAKMVKKNGRTTESRLVMTLAWKAGISRLFSMLPLGLKLMRTGRMRLFKERVHNKKQIKNIFQVVEGQA